MPKTPHVNFRLARKTIDELDQIAESYGLTSRADALRVAVGEWAKIRREQARKEDPEKSPVPP